MNERDLTGHDVPGSYRAGGTARWVAAHLELDGEGLVIREWSSATAASAEVLRRVGFAEVEGLDELAPFGGTLQRVEARLHDGGRFEVLASPQLVAGWCEALAATRPLAPVADRRDAERPPRRPSRRRVAFGALATLALVGVGAAFWPDHHLERAAAGTTSTTATSTTASTTTTSTTTTTTSTTTTTTSTTTTTTTTTTAPPPPTTTAPPPPPVEMVTAPLTGLPAPAPNVARPAIVSKISAEVKAMPPVGMEMADVVVEVRIEYGLSRYLAVWHSRDAPVIGPHRSARTTDPDLLAMFGQPLFAYSGGNPKVVEHLSRIPWKVDVAHGAVPDAYFRDERWPYPNNLFARPDVLRTRGADARWPRRQFAYRPEGTAPVGIPVQSFVAAAGPPVQFRWDAALGGWRRRIHDREHVHANGTPVAPNNVVVIETTYGESFADARSPEAKTLGRGRAWVFSEGRVTAGTWTRLRNTDPWNLRDGAGNSMLLTPGTTWVVVGKGGPIVLG